MAEETGYAPARSNRSAAMSTMQSRGSLGHYSRARLQNCCGAAKRRPRSAEIRLMQPEAIDVALTRAIHVIHHVALGARAPRLIDRTPRGTAHISDQPKPARRDYFGCSALNPRAVNAAADRMEVIGIEGSRRSRLCLDRASDERFDRRTRR